MKKISEIDMGNSICSTPTQPPILYKDHFYAQYTINERSDGLVCMGMDGQVKWKTGDEPAFNKGG